MSIRQYSVALFCAGIVSACQPRSELVLGFVTDLSAPDTFDTVTLKVTRVADGHAEGGDGDQWSILGNSGATEELPGTFGLSSDGVDVLVDVALTASKGGAEVVSQRARLSIVAGETKFYRLGLTATCIGRADCPSTETCVEGVCRSVEVNAAQLPDYAPDLVSSLSCITSTPYINTATKTALPQAAAAGECGPGLCRQGLCMRPPPPTASGTRTVSGLRSVTYIQPSRSITTPLDASTLAPTVLTDDGTGSFRSLIGTGNTDGTFSIAGVPNGDYYFKLGSDYYVTADNTFDLGEDELGRADRRFAANPATSISLNLTGLSPWSQRDHLEAYSADIDTWGEFLETCRSISPGATSLANYNYTYQPMKCVFSGGRGAALSDNDDFVIVHLSTQTTPSGVRYLAATEFAAPTRFTQADGTNTVVTAVMQPVVQDRHLDIVFATSLWDSAVGYNGTNATLLNPKAVGISREFFGFSDFSFAVEGTPSSLGYGRIGVTADFCIPPNPQHFTDLSVNGMTFATPVPSSEHWGFFVEAFASYVVNVTPLPNTTCSDCKVFAANGAQLGLNAVRQSFGPPLGPVIHPKIDDGTGLADLFTARTIATTTPVIAWDPPAIGTPALVTVQIVHLLASGGKTSVKKESTVSTSHGSVRLPPGVLLPGETYVLTLRAETSRSTSAPLRLSLSSFSVVVTEEITVSAQASLPSVN